MFSLAGILNPFWFVYFQLQMWLIFLFSFSSFLKTVVKLVNLPLKSSVGILHTVDHLFSLFLYLMRILHLDALKHEQGGYNNP